MRAQARCSVRGTASRMPSAFEVLVSQRPRTCLPGASSGGAGRSTAHTAAPVLTRLLPFPPPPPATGPLQRLTLGPGLLPWGPLGIKRRKEEVPASALGWRGLAGTLGSSLDLSVAIPGPRLGDGALCSTVNHVWPHSETGAKENGMVFQTFPCLFFKELQFVSSVAHLI